MSLGKSEELEREKLIKVVNRLPGSGKYSDMISGKY